MSDTKIFRSQIGGFNRDDVNNYIKETDLKHSAEIEALRAEIAELAKKNEEIDALKAEKNELEAKLGESEASKNNLLIKLSAAEKASVIKADELAAKEKELADTLKSMTFYKNESEAQIKVIASKKDEIEEITKKHIEFAAKAEENLNAEKKKSAALESDNAALTADKDTLISEKNELIAERLSLLEAKNALTAEKDSLALKFDELCRSLEEAKKFNENADDKNSPAYKVGMYDKISSQLGDILINANRNADDLITSAKEDAERLRAEVDAECEQKRAECDTYVAQTKAEIDEEASYIRERLSRTANELLTAISDDLHGSIEHCIHEINTDFTDIQYEFKTLLSKIAARSNELNDHVNYYQSCVADGIEEKLSVLDEKYGIHRHDNGDVTNA